MSTMLTFLAFSFLFLATGIVLYVLSDQITEITKRYDNATDCDGKATCRINLIDDNAGETSGDIKAPIYVYYQLENFYQNHRRYVKSRDNEQLYGTYKTPEDLSSCDPIVKNSDLWSSQ